MNPRKPTKGPQGPRPAQGRHPQHYWHHYRPWPHHYYWYDYDYDWYDYDYDWYDYLYDDYTQQRPKKPAGPAPTAVNDFNSDEYASYYQQGFKDGWKAAMDYVMYGEGQEPMPAPPMPPMPPVPGPSIPREETE